MIYITGDIHGSMRYIYNFLDNYRPESNDIIVLLGDVGINYTGTSQDKRMKQLMNNYMVKYGSVFFCVHGNHENRPQNIDSYVEKEWRGGRVLYEEKYPNILFPIDGEIFELEGKKCLVIGGAYSVDKYYRLAEGHKWWADEQPSPEIKAYVEEQISQKKVDIIFSHTCPAKYIPTECFLPMIDQSTVDNSTEEWLDMIEDKVDYQAWYCGHWHTNKHIDKLHFLYHDIETLRSELC